MNRVQIFKCHVCRCFFAIDNAFYDQFIFHNHKSLHCPVCDTLTGVFPEREDILDNATGIPSSFESTERDIVRYYRDIVRYYACSRCGYPHIVLGYSQFCVFCGAVYRGDLQEQSTKQALCASVLLEDIDQTILINHIDCCCQELEEVENSLQQVLDSLKESQNDFLTNRCKSLVTEIDSIRCDVNMATTGLNRVRDRFNS